MRFAHVRVFKKICTSGRILQFLPGPPVQFSAVVVAGVRRGGVHPFPAAAAANVYLDFGPGLKFQFCGPFSQGSIVGNRESASELKQKIPNVEIYE